MGLSVALLLPAAPALIFAEYGPIYAVLTSLVGLWAGFALGYTLYRKYRYRVKVQYRTRPERTPLRTILKGLLLGVGLQLALVLVGFLIILSFGFDASQVSNVQSLPFEDAGYESIYLLLFLMVSAGIIAPILEELFFRGAVLPVIASRFGPALGIAVSALLFGAMHIQPTYESSIYMVMLTTIAGLAFGWLRLRTRSLLLPIGAHVGFNSWALAIALLVSGF